MPAKHITKEDYDLALKVYYRSRSYGSVSRILDVSHKFAKKLVEEGTGDWPPLKEAIEGMEATVQGPKKSDEMRIDPEQEKKFYLAAYKTIQKKAVEQIKNDTIPEVDPKQIKGLVMLKEFGEVLVKDSREGFDVLALPVDDMTLDELNDLATGKAKIRR